MKKTLNTGLPAIVNSFLITFFVGMIIWLPRGFGLDRFVTTDEVAWLPRSANFYYMLGQRDFALTYFNPSPGVITMWVETAAHLIEFPEYRGFGQGVLDKYSLYEKFLISHNINPHDILVTSRVLMVLLNTLVLILTFLYVRRLFGTPVAVLGFLFIALEPYHIGITRLSHLDGIMSSFLLLSLTSLLAYLLDGQRILDLAFSGAMAGFAVLSKIPALLLLPTVIILLALHIYFQNYDSTLRKIGLFPTLFTKLVKLAVIWISVFVLSIFVLLPAMWVHPVHTFTKILMSPFRFSNQVIVPENNTNPSTQEPQEPTLEGFENEETGEEPPSLLDDYIFKDNILSYFTRYPAGFITKISLVSIIGCLLLLAAVYKKRRTDTTAAANRAVVYLSVFIIIYTIFLTIPPKSSSKYYIPVYPLVNIISAVGWYAFISWIAEKNKTKFSQISAIIPIVLILALSTQAINYYPYYLPYHNMLGYNDTAWGSGEGLDQAAAYINQKPQSSKITVLSWYGIGPFSYYFTGKTISFHVGEEPWGQRRIKELENVDYIITYANQWRRDLPPGLNNFLSQTEPEYRIWINRQEYARIYRVDSIRK